MSISVIEMTGRTVIYDADADNTAENDVRAGPCTLYGVSVKNPNAAVAYLKFYDSAAPTVGTTAPDEIVMLEGSGGLNGGYMHWQVNGTSGLSFTTGLSFACVTGAGTAGTTSPTSNVLVTLEVT